MNTFKDVMSRTDTGLYGYDGEPISFEQWRELWDDPKRIVKQTNHRGGVLVSTVYIGGPALSHPPLIYETMIFGGPLDQFQTRWETREQAEIGHKEVVQMVRDVNRRGVCQCPSWGYKGKKFDTSTGRPIPNPANKYHCLRCGRFLVNPEPYLPG